MKHDSPIMSNKNILFYKGKQQISFNFTGEKLSSDAAVLLLEKVEKKHRLIKGFSAQLPDERDQSKVEFSHEQLLKQRIYLMAQGYEDCNDESYLKNDPIIQEALGGNLSSQPTLSRFENSFSIRDIYNISIWHVDRYISNLDPKRKQIIIDVDGTDDPTHGHQQLSLFNGFYGQTMYHEMFFHDGETGEIILPVLRPGNVHSNKWFVSILKRIVNKIQDKYPDIQIIIRGDSGFSTPKFYELVEQKKLLFCLGISSNNVLKQQNKVAYNIIEKYFGKTNKKYQYFSKGFDYQAGTWKTPQKVYAKIESTGKGMNVRYFCSNMENSKVFDAEKFKKVSEQIYKEFYTQRGDASENRIKEVKNMCFSDRLSCHRFIANYIRLFISSLTYELMRILKTYIAKTKHKNAHKWQIDNIRLFLLKVAASIKKTARRVYVKFSKSYICQDLFVEINALI